MGNLNLVMAKKALGYTYLVLVAAVLLHGWLVPRGAQGGDTVTPAGTHRLGGDSVVFGAIVQRVQAGESYYAATRTELQTRNYPTASVFNWRTPAHISVLASTTITGARVILTAITIAAIWLLMPASWLSTPTLILVGVPLLASTILVGLSEAWAGALIALSLGGYGRQRWVLGAVCGVLAVFMRELAGPYAVVGAALAFRGRRKTESLIWVVGGVLYLAYYMWHVQNVLASMPPDARAHGAWWVQWGGLVFIYRTVECYGLATLAPSLMVPLVVTAGLIGIASNQMPMHARVALVAYMGAFAVVGLPINRYWGLITVPFWGVGASYAGAGLQRLFGGPGGVIKLAVLARRSVPHSLTRSLPGPVLAPRLLTETRDRRPVR